MQIRNKQMMKLCQYITDVKEELCQGLSAHSLDKGMTKADADRLKLYVSQINKFSEEFGRFSSDRPDVKHSDHPLFNEIEAEVCEIMSKWGPDGHCDGSDLLTDLVIKWKEKK